MFDRCIVAVAYRNETIRTIGQDFVVFNARISCNTSIDEKNVTDVIKALAKAKGFTEFQICSISYCPLKILSEYVEEVIKYFDHLYDYSHADFEKWDNCSFLDTWIEV